MPPRALARPLQRLPPILDNVSQTPTSSCSKGARGLSVQPRVLGIFTETTVSPDPSLRQRPSRYAIRAGRNFVLFLCFQRHRLSLHPRADSREQFPCRSAASRSDSFPERARRSWPGLLDLDERRPPSGGTRSRSVQSRTSSLTTEGISRSGESRAPVDPGGDAFPI